VVTFLLLGFLDHVVDPEKDKFEDRDSRKREGNQARYNILGVMLL